MRTHLYFGDVANSRTELRNRGPSEFAEVLRKVDQMNSRGESRFRGLHEFAPTARNRDLSRNRAGSCDFVDFTISREVTNSLLPARIRDLAKSSRELRNRDFTISREVTNSPLPARIRDLP